eukprot:10912368-Ditylum_brightwellii.AAC.1
MWQHFHLYHEEEISVEEEEKGGKGNIREEDNMINELCLEHVVHNKEKDECESNSKADAGQSLETHCMKNKPVNAGYIFFCLVTKEG